MDRLKDILANRYFWIVLVMLAICSFFHYAIPAAPTTTFPMTRQAVVRIIFLLPVVAGSLAFGYLGGVVTLGLAVAVMLPRVIWISELPADALFETIGVAVVGLVLVWLIEVQEREKRLRQKAVEQLATVNAVALTLTRPYDLDSMLNKALDRVLEVVGSLEPRGAIFLVDPRGQMLHLRAHRGMPPEVLERERKVPIGECLCGMTAEVNEVLIVRDALAHPNHTRCPYHEPHSHVCVPLTSKGNLLGVMDFYLRDIHLVDAIDREMFAAIGHQVGVAVENARLCESMRHYVRKITEAQEEERKRIARELHDDTIQGLIDLSRRIDTLAVDEGLSGSAAERVEQFQARVEEMVRGVRRFSRDLRPPILDDLGLLAALEALISDLGSRGVEARLEVTGEKRRLRPETELELYRIVQEALNNTRRHSGASEVVVGVEFRGARIRVTVHDDGNGFAVIGRPGDFGLMGQFGLIGMEERAQRLGGYFKVLTSAERGTIVVVDVPV
ncbi:MAG: GAF domain-containing sensor histidine kinase [Anaerolineae bacterium]|nr:GAF domain-containing sensor histidine kinase [Anaerolineae bacterium]